MEVVKYVLRFKLRFSDTWRPQVEAVQSFLNLEGIRTTVISHETHEGKHDAFRFDVGSIGSVLKAAKAMLPSCVKKAEDLSITIDYLEGRITGNQAISRFNEEVRIGRRSGYIRNLDLHFTREQGLRVAKLENARKARAAHIVKVNEEVQDNVRKDNRVLGLGHIRLSRKYGYSVGVIRRILGTR